VEAKLDDVPISKEGEQEVILQHQLVWRHFQKVETIESQILIQYESIQVQQTELLANDPGIRI
jgi:hypothetical protein